MQELELIHKFITENSADGENLVRIFMSKRPEDVQQMSAAYAHFYGKPLFDAIFADIKGPIHIRNTLLGLLLLPFDFEAFIAREAFQGDAVSRWNKNKNFLIVYTLASAVDGNIFNDVPLAAMYQGMKAVEFLEYFAIDALVGRSNLEIASLKQAYLGYGTQLEDIITRSFSGYFFLGALNNMLLLKRNEASDFPIEADTDALHKAVGKRAFHPNQRTVLDILTSRSYQSIGEIARFYRKKYGRSLINDLGKFSDYKKALYSGIVQYALDPADYIADQFRNAIYGKEVNPSTLIFLTFRHFKFATKDLRKEIKEAYLKKYKRSLEESIDNNVGGTERKILISLIKFY